MSMTELMKHDAGDMAREIEALMGHLLVMIEHGDDGRVIALAEQIENKARGFKALIKALGTPETPQAPSRINPGELPILSNLLPEQCERLRDPITAQLYAILDEARVAHEAASIAFASAAEDADGALLRRQVTSDIAAGAALHALTQYVVRGNYYSNANPDPQPSELHEQCRLARNEIEAKIAEVFAVTKGDAS